MAKALNQPIHWHLLGAGAIGTVLGDRLQSAGDAVSVFVRNEHNAPDTLTVSLKRHRGENTPAAFQPVDFSIARRSKPSQIQHLLVTTKSYDVYPAVQSIAHLVAEHCQVILLTNGMGLAERLEAAFPALNIVCGTTTEGAYRDPPNSVIHAGRGHTRLGPLSSDLDNDIPPAWFAHWQRALPESTWDNDIKAALWAKLAVNCVINPLTALYRCRNGELATRAEAARDVATLCREVQQVSYACGFTATAQSLRSTVADVIDGTAANQSSMLQDVLAGRQTEIEDITGYLLREADRYGIPVPENKRMLESVRALC